MRNKLVSIVLGIGLSLLSGAASAEDQQIVWKITLARHGDGTTGCNVVSNYASAGAKDSLIHITSKADIPAELKLYVDGGPSSPLPMVRGDMIVAHVAKKELSGKVLILRQGEKLLCAQPMMSPAPPLAKELPGNSQKPEVSSADATADSSASDKGANGASVRPPNSNTRYFERLDQLALRYLRDSLQIQEHRVSGGEFGKTYDIYHLPSGRLAFPIAAHISEKDRIRLHVATPEGASAKVDVSACDNVPSVRILGSVDESTKDLSGEKRNRTADTLPSDNTRFVLLDHSQTLQCAGTLRYRVQVTTEVGESSSPPTAITVDPVYLLSVGVSFIFDFGKPSKITLQDVDSSGNDSQKLIQTDRQFSGFRPLLSFGLHPCRSNPHNWSACDWIVPFVALDPSRLTQGFAAGVGISPFSGITIQGGMSLFQSEILDSSVSVGIGDRWSKPGEPTKRTVFNGDSVGGFIGIGLSSDLYHRLWSR